MALQRLPEIAPRCCAAGRAPDEPVALLSEATTPRQRRTLTTLAGGGRVAPGTTDRRTDADRDRPVVGLAAILSPWQQTGPPTVADAPTTAAQPSSEPAEEAPMSGSALPDPARERARSRPSTSGR